MPRRSVVHASLLPYVLTACLLALFAGCGPTEPAPDTFEPPGGAGADTAAVPTENGMGQLLYVPVYSHIFHRDASRQFDLAVTVSVRNTDPEHAITVTMVRYFDGEGRLVRRYLDEPHVLRPLSSEAFVVAETDRTGGVGANFLVRWHAGQGVSPPIAEAVMISTAGTQGISFVSRGVPVRPLDALVEAETP